MTTLLPHISRRTCCGAIVFLAFLHPGHTAHASDDDLVEMRMEGYADGIGLAARHEAIENAKQEIIRKLLNNIVADGELGHLRTILRQSSRYIRGHYPLRHDFIGDTTRVEIDAYVNLPALYNDVAVTMLPFLPEPPRLLLVIGEQLPHDEIVAVPDFGYADTALREALSKFRLQVTGVETIIEQFSQAELIEAVSGGLELGSAFARAQQSDVVILGAVQVEAEETAPGSNVFRHKATATVRLYRGGNGEFVDAFTEIAAVSSADQVEGSVQAVEDACEKLAGDITMASVLAVLGAAKDPRVLLTLEHPGAGERMAELERLLREAFGYNNVEIYFTSERFARIRVDYDGPMIDFVDLISSGAFADAYIQVHRAVGREVEAEFVPLEHR